jgi:hypothetical protein
VSLATPEKIRTLQRALYVKAKQEPTRRFHFLYDKVWREDILAHAYACCRANGGAPGVDGETFSGIESYGVGRWLDELREEVRAERYKPQPVRRVMIPKANGVGQRPLGIPPIRDRVVQAAALLVLEPIFEADFDEAAYGYRPKRSAIDAVRTVHQAIKGISRTLGAAVLEIGRGLPRQHASPQQFEAGVPIHLPLDHFQPIDVAFDRAVAPPTGDGLLHRVQVASQHPSKLCQEMKVRRHGRVHPGREPFRRPPSQHGAKPQGQSTQFTGLRAPSEERVNVTFLLRRPVFRVEEQRRHAP